jgi:hypothetical protein
LKIEIFTVEQANRRLTEIRPEIVRLVAIKGEFDRLQTEMAVLQLAAAGTPPENPDARELRRLGERRDQLADQIARGVAGIHRHGCLVKDLDRGLVDFYALAGDRLVFLCWKADEAEVSHWHTLEGGFGQRQSLKQTELE